LSSPPSRSSPVGQHLPWNIRTLFKSPPEYLCPLEPPSVSPATLAPLCFCRNISRGHPCVLWPFFSSAAGFIPFLFRSDSSSGFPFAPEHSYLLFRRVGCLHLVPGPLRTPVLCSDHFPSSPLCQQSFVCLRVHVPLTLITTSPEITLMPHGTL